MSSDNNNTYPFYSLHPSLTTPLSILSNAATSFHHQQQPNSNTFHNSNNPSFSSRRDIRTSPMGVALGLGKSGGLLGANNNKNGVSTTNTRKMSTNFLSNINNSENPLQVQPKRPVAMATTALLLANHPEEINMMSVKANITPDINVSGCTLGATVNNNVSSSNQNDSDSVFSEDTVELFVNRSCGSNDGKRKANDAKSITPPPQIISFVSPMTVSYHNQAQQTNQLSLLTQSHTCLDSQSQLEQYQRQQPKETVKKDKEHVVQPKGDKLKGEQQSKQYASLKSRTEDVKKSMKRKKSEPLSKKAKNKHMKSRPGQSPSDLKKEPVKPRCGKSYM